MRDRGEGDIWVVVTGVALMTEIFGVAIGASIAAFLGYLSPVETLVCWIVCLGGLVALVPFIVTDGEMSRSAWGIAGYGVMAVGQLVLIALLLHQAAVFADPHLGIAARSLALRFIFLALPLLILTGSTRLMLKGPRRQRTGATVRLVTGVGLSVTALSIGLAAVAGSAPATGLDCSTFSFDHDVWGTATPEHRQRIAHHLITCDRIEGESRDSVAALLGPADEESPHRLVFEMGQINGFLAPDRTRFEVDFEGRLAARARIIRESTFD